MERPTKYSQTKPARLVPPSHSFPPCLDCCIHNQPLGQPHSHVLVPQFSGSTNHCGLQIVFLTFPHMVSCCLTPAAPHPGPRLLFFSDALPPLLGHFSNSYLMGPLSSLKKAKCLSQFSVPIKPFRQFSVWSYPIPLLSYTHSQDFL